MKSMIDRLRSTPASRTVMTVFGFDPDLDTTGWSCVTGTVVVPPTGKTLVTSVHLGMVETQIKGTDVQKAAAMIAALCQWHAPNSEAVPHGVFVEAQQVYPTKDEDMGKRIAKANDLLRLAQITGAVQALGSRVGIAHVHAVLPATWKGQQHKDSTVAMLQQRLPGAVITLHHSNKPNQVVDAAALDHLPARMGHALDAVGVALYGLDHLALHHGVAS